MHAVNADSGHGADNCRNERRQGSDKQGVVKGIHNRLVLKHLRVPFGRKTAPECSGLCIIEGQNHHCNDGGI